MRAGNQHKDLPKALYEWAPARHRIISCCGASGARACAQVLRRPRPAAPCARGPAGV